MLAIMIDEYGVLLELCKHIYINVTLLKTELQHWTLTNTCMHAYTHTHTHTCMHMHTNANY